MNGNVPPLWLYLPLWGVSFDSDDVGGVGGNVLASIPYPDEWEAIQQKEVVRERQRLAGYPFSFEAPPCITVMEKCLADETIDATVIRVGEKMLSQAQTAVLAMRLYKSGWFLTPDQAEICFAINGRGWSLRRRPGPYRQAFLIGLDNMPFLGYELKIADLTTSKNEPGAITLLWQQLAEMQSHAGNASLEIALENFNRSYGFQLRPSQRLAHLFMALDAMLGGFNEDKPGGVKITGSNSKFSQRFKAALLADGQEFIKANQESGWLNNHKLGGGRWLRNCIAHGENIDSDGLDDEVQLRLQEIVRILLRQYIRFLLRWNIDKSSISQQFSLPKTCSPVGAYNAILAACASEVEAAFDLLS
jgi:hypothetical protein